MSIRFVVLFGPPAVGKMTVGREIRQGRSRRGPVGGECVEARSRTNADGAV